MPLLLGGHYLPIDKIGGGILGSTFLAEDLHSISGRRYVIKLLPAQENLTPEQLKSVKERFRQEAKILETLGSEHQQIPSLYAYFELTVLGFSGTKLRSDQTEELFYLVEEYIDGRSLAEELTQRGQFREVEAIALLRQILPVLQFIHEHDYGVIHEAICPEHIMRDRKGRVYLTNFGAVKRVVNAGAVSHAIRSATLLATPPEQRAGDIVSPSSDLYTLAATMLRLLTNQDLQTLFNAETQSWHWRPYAQVSDHLGNILDKMLQPSVRQRFQSAVEVIAVLNPETSAGLQLTLPQPLLTTESIQALTQETLIGEHGNQPRSNARLNGRLQTKVEPSIKQSKRLPKLNLSKPEGDQSNRLESRLSSPFESEVQAIHVESNVKSISEETLVEPLPQSTIDQQSTGPETQTNYRFCKTDRDTSGPSSKRTRRTSGRDSIASSSAASEARETAVRSGENFPIAEVLQQSAILGSGGWFVVAALASFLGTVLASGLWLLMLAGVIFGLLAQGQPLLEKIRLLIIAIASAGLTFLLVPQFFRMFSLAQALPQLLLLALASGLFALILIVLSQMASASMSKK